MDLALVAGALGVTPDDIASADAESVTTRDGVRHTFADPARFGLEPFEAPKSKAAPAAPKSDPA